MPHDPQCWSSLWRLTQALPQRICIIGQRHVPIMQVAPVGHDVPHAPQLRRSLWRLTQALPQALRPAGQAQRPAMQD